MSTILARTSNGDVRGLATGKVRVFKGIRYGAPTSETRFQPPRRPAPWSGVADACEFGPAAPQTLPGAGFRNPSMPRVVAPGLLLFREIRFLRGSEPESEDCLFLNVWTLGTEPERKRPVLFWIHGGGFNAGAGSSPVCDGTHLAQRGDVVVVSVNHRLGALGFADLHGLLGTNTAKSSNVGMLDLILALEWVRENVSNFGGDPECVTIFGQSGGGWKVSALLGMPAAQGLFHRAVIQSGPGVHMATAAEAGALAERFVSELSETVGDVRQAPVEDLLRAQASAELSLGPRLIPNLMRGFVPVVDGVTLPTHPFAADSPMLGLVPILVGHTRTEMTVFLDAESLALDDAELDAKAEMFGPNSRDALAHYRGLHPDASATRLLSYLHSDAVMLPYIPLLLERHTTAGGAAGFYYRVDYETPVLDGALMAPHGVEVPFVFGSTEWSQAYVGAGPAVDSLAELMGSAWLAFAEHGDPRAGGDALSEWSAYAADAPTAMIFDGQSRVELNPQAADRPVAESVFEGLTRNTDLTL